MRIVSRTDRTRARTSVRSSPERTASDHGMSATANASYQCTPRIRCASATASVEAFWSGCFSVS